MADITPHLHIRNGLLAVLAVWACTGCLGPVAELYPDDRDERPVPVHIVKVGWHAGLVVESEHLGDAFPDHEYMPDGERLKIGWGDDKYYPDSDPSFWVLLRAIFWPSRSVLHVVGMDVPVERYFPGSDVITLHISEEGMQEMTDFLVGYFRTDDSNQPIYHSYGRYGASAFFKARGRYYIPKTSNVFTARALRAAGVPITPVYAVTAGNVMRQAGRAADED
ncbi:DUF2459 domain-containing protein [Balneolales bacterium ANBcel1]|nr:DUF2459 domain-containing protein [Balneolales bacterium ANBcel1]